MLSSADAFSFPDLETTRTRLRILKPDDAESVRQHFSDERVTRFMDIDVCRHLDEAREIIEFHLNDAGCRWGIFDRDTNALLGTVGYHCWDKIRHVAEIGYDLGHAWWGQGLMREVLHVVIPFGFSEMMLERIEADPAAENLRSIRLLQRLGFRPDAALRDGLQWYYLDKPIT